MSQMMQEEQDAQAEYYALADLKLGGRLSPAQEARLREVKAALDQMEAQEPEMQAMFARMAEVADKLDTLLAKVQALPKK